MIYFLAHSDWILYNSRKEIASNLQTLNYTVNAITTNEKYKAGLQHYFNDFHEWDVDRNKLIDFKGIFVLRKILKKLGSDDILHVYTLKSGLYVLFASHFQKKKIQNYYFNYWPRLSIFKKYNKQNNEKYSQNLYEILF